MHIVCTLCFGGANDKYFSCITALFIGWEKVEDVGRIRRCVGIPCFIASWGDWFSNSATHVVGRMLRGTPRWTGG